MASNIDPTLGGSLAVGQQPSKSEMQTTLQAAKDEIEALQDGGGAFLGLDDTPTSFAANGSKVAVVNAGETAIEFRDIVGHPFPGLDTRGDEAVALVSGSSKQCQLFSTTLTAARTLTLPSSNLWTGQGYLIRRTAAGDFALNVSNLGSGGGSTFALYQNEWAVAYYEGSQWDVIQFGYLDRHIAMRDAELSQAQAAAFTLKRSSISISSGTLTLDASTSSEFEATLDANVTAIALTNVDAGVTTDLRLRLIQDGTGGRTVDFTAITVNGSGVTEKFDRGAPVMSSAANSEDSYLIRIIAGDLTTARVLVEYQGIA